MILLARITSKAERKRIFDLLKAIVMAALCILIVLALIVYCRNGQLLGIH